MRQHPGHQVNVSRKGVLCAPDYSKSFETPCIRRLRRTIKELSQFNIKKPEELELEFDNFDADYSYLTSPFKGRNIVDLDFVYKQLLDGHKACKTTLSFTQYHRERLIGLASTLYLTLQNCSTVTMVKTSIYDDNNKCASDTYTKFLL